MSITKKKCLAFFNVSCKVSEEGKLTPREHTYSPAVYATDTVHTHTHTTIRIGRAHLWPLPCWPWPLLLLLLMGFLSPWFCACATTHLEFSAWERAREERGLRVWAVPSSSRSKIGHGEEPLTTERERVEETYLQWGGGFFFPSVKLLACLILFWFRRAATSPTNPCCSCAWEFVGSYLSRSESLAR
jgi:hypothetical protein